jgi:hypothetical protein
LHAPSDAQIALDFQKTEKVYSRNFSNEVFFSVLDIRGEEKGRFMRASFSENLAVQWQPRN